VSRREAAERVIEAEQIRLRCRRSLHTAGATRDRVHHLIGRVDEHHESPRVCLLSDLGSRSAESTFRSAPPSPSQVGPLARKINECDEVAPSGALR
jgi:hypothetical protein